MNRGRFLVNLIEERNKENVTPPIVPTPLETLEDDLNVSSSDEVSGATHTALTVVDESMPSTSQEWKPTYYISPIRSDESDIDDSDADPNFQLVTQKKKLI